ncbi:DUF6745 domain-containing protein [Moorena sp. SIO3H5]|uniref:DUF6745 domain-containing protein n=1 Tax=Moorena sp. SIO3H5 TaxID=2607834 RepID=UPI0025CD4763|nr:hypothetical protein [Moorena sp. SIO3H5]
MKTLPHLLNSALSTQHSAFSTIVKSGLNGNIKHRYGDMWQPNIKHLTPEQETLIPTYQEKWHNLSLLTGAIDRHEATVAINAAYTAIGKPVPDIVFCDSPYGFFQIILNQLQQHIDSQLKSQLQPRLESQLINQLRQHLNTQLGKELQQELLYQLGRKLNIKRISRQLEEKLWQPLDTSMGTQLHRQLQNQLLYELDTSTVSQQRIRLGLQVLEQLGTELRLFMSPLYWSIDSSRFDFYISVLNCPHHQTTWEIFQSLVKHCSWMFPCENICFVCDRPTKVSFDTQDRLHREGQPAMEFADGFSLYSYHGVTLPEKYGTVNPNQWQAGWLLEEPNAELRRILIEGIGYARICQDLEAQRLDSWQEYTLLTINNDIDIEPIFLLKMTCPSTNFVHIIRVPPHVESAREAIRWVNWDTDPEEFLVQT